MQTYRNTIVVVSCLTTVNAFYYDILANKQDFTKKNPSFSKLNVIKSTREKKPFRLIGSLRVILKNSKNYSRVLKTALQSTKKNQRVSSNYVSSISQRSRWSFQCEINLISVQASRTQNICEEDKIRIMRKSIHSFFYLRSQNFRLCENQVCKKKKRKKKAYSHDKSILQSVFSSALQLKLDILYTVHFHMQLIKEFHVSHHMHVANIL